jgi:hypothetical protein
LIVACDLIHCITQQSRPTAWDWIGGSAFGPADSSQYWHQYQHTPESQQQTISTTSSPITQQVCYAVIITVDCCDGSDNRRHAVMQITLALLAVGSIGNIVAMQLSLLTLTTWVDLMFGFGCCSG